MSPPIPVLMDTNPYFWSSIDPNFSFSKFLSHVLAFLNSILLPNQLNQVVVIATGFNSCGYVFYSSGSVSQRPESLLPKLEEFVENDESPTHLDDNSVNGVGSSLLSVTRRWSNLSVKPRILCLHGSPDGPGQYVAIMNAIFSAQRSMTVFATDLHSWNFLQLPKPVGVDFRASCFCHKSTIDMGFICSVCLSIFCRHQKKCSTCGSIFGQAQTLDPSASEQK